MMAQSYWEGDLAMVWKVRLLAIIGVLMLPVGTAGAVSYGFGCITNNSATDCGIAEAQITMDVSDEGGGQVRFTFSNAGPLASVIESLYFDDGTLLGIASIVNGPGVSFMTGASPPDLPGGQMASPPFQTTAGFLADSDPAVSINGVGPGEFVAIIFDLQGGGTFGDVIAELADGSLRAGIHVIAFEGGGSESLVNVPEPGTGVLALLGLAGFGVMRRRHASA
jgi:MYXO-CTERM domain-containing protein